MKIHQFVFWLALSSSCASFLAQSAVAAEPSSITPDFSTVLRSGDSRLLRDALDHGSSPKARDADGNTTLMQAAVYGDLACLRVLLERGADVNATNHAGATALMRAAFDYQKAKLLLERGADLKARSGLGNTTLMLAARPWNSHRTVKLLLARGADAKATNNWGATALMAAVAGGDAESVGLLLEHGAEVNAQLVLAHDAFIFGGGRSALMWAAYRGDLPI